MKTRLINVMVMLVLMIGAFGCASIPCSPPDDSATCEVNYAISIASQVDQNLQAIATSIPLGAGVAKAVQAYHVALPEAKQAARDALAAYEAGTSKDYTSAVNFLIALYGDINKVIVAAGQPDQVKAATAKMAAVK